MDPEEIRLPLDFGTPTLKKLELKNLDTPKEEAIIAVKSLISLHQSDPTRLLIFCDGSFHPEKGGAGAAVCPARNVFSSYALGGSTLVSNHKSEAVGVLAAMGLARTLSTDPTIRQLVVLVDNQGVIRRIGGPVTPKPGQQLFDMIFASMSELPCHLDVSFVWCPGHRDIMGNELADRLAKEALESPSSQQLLIKGNFKKVLRRSTASLSPKPPVLSGLHISLSSLINQLASGHNALNHHLFKICRSLDPLCPKCGARETVFHLMNLCPQVRIQRISLRKHLRHSRIRFRANRLDLVLGNRKAEVALAKFLLDSNRFTDQLPR
jgi:ribonuclease HI